MPNVNERKDVCRVAPFCVGALLAVLPTCCKDDFCLNCIRVRMQKTDGLVE